jgi:hypothetical protein
MTRVRSTALALLAGLAPADESGAVLPGQIVVHPSNPAWLIRHPAGAGESRFFMSGPGDPEDFLYRGSENPDGTRDGDQQEVIDELIASGANSLYLQAIRSHGGDGNATHNPFVGHAPGAPLDPDILDQWETPPGWCCSSSSTTTLRTPSARAARSGRARPPSSRGS